MITKRARKVVLALALAGVFGTMTAPVSLARVRMSNGDVASYSAPETNAKTSRSVATGTAPALDIQGGDAAVKQAGPGDMVVFTTRNVAKENVSWTDANGKEVDGLKVTVAGRGKLKTTRIEITFPDEEQYVLTVGDGKGNDTVLQFSVSK